MLFLQQIINGLSVGSVYALIALGYTMVYGIIKLINFAHGEVMMAGAYFAFVVAISSRFPFPIVLFISMVMAAIVGIVIEKLAYKPLRNAPRISALITAIGVSLFLQNLTLVIFKADPKIMPVLIEKKPINIGSLQIGTVTLTTLILAIVFMVILDVFIKKTKPGKAMRAVSEDKDASVLMGINVNKTISITFAIGSALGALGGVLYGITYTQVYPTMGIMPGLKAFVAAVLGGIGLIPGAVLGGFVIGMIETISKAYISSQWSDAIVFGLLIVVLLFKPTGILGKNEKEKV
ncbi:branched-chain amino acid ABC transporter permease [Fusibacter ferrireducens]|uniref:branched-chain amino acid ABC transporter permease n=1 Tax=Fusibacter ferrireducens TaxID=2785058 RepID=UPI002B464545|nr:branched-chain amino acid ABC transporter permease [Fusibacter ferrireducens]